MALALAFLFGCSGDTAEVVFPERTTLAPLEEVNLAPPVLPDGEQDTPEVITLTSGFDLSRFHFWTHMRGYVHADVGDVWAALQVPDVMVDRRIVDSYTVSDEGFRPDVDFSYVFSAEMSLPGKQIDFDITWLHAVEAGELDEPSLVVASWDLTDGPPFLERITGTVELEAVEPGLTEIRGIFHMRAFPQGAGSMEQYWRDLHADLLSTLDGEPVDTYD